MIIDPALWGDGSMLFDWYLEGTTPSQVFDGFRLSRPSARIFDALAGRVGAIVAGRNTYEDSDHFGGGSPHPTARLFVLTSTTRSHDDPHHRRPGLHRVAHRTGRNIDSTDDENREPS